MSTPTTVGTLYYLPLRGRAECLRMMLAYAGLPYTNRVVSLDEWPALKPSMPPGLGAEFPNRPKGNRGLPVLELPDGTRMPESVDIALHIARVATDAGTPLLPSDPKEAEVAAKMYEASQSLPLAWPMACLVRFPVEKAEAIMRGESMGEWMEGPRSFDRLMPTLRALVKELGDGPFFGGERPHYGDFGVWRVADNLTLLDPEAHKGLGRAWDAWVQRMSGLPGCSEYLANRPGPPHNQLDPDAGYPGSIIVTIVDPKNWGGMTGNIQ